MTTLRRPLYQQLMQTVRRRIESGQLKPGEKAPSESDLIAEFRVSSTTARRCLNELATAGLVRRVQGKGTFVAPHAAGAACKHIGVFYHDLVDLTDTFSSAALRGITAAIGERGGDLYEPLLLHLGRVRRSEDHASAMAEMVRQHNLDAVLLMSPVPPEWLPPVPTAAVNFSYDDPAIISVTCDHGSAFSRLTSRLRELNHERVVILRGRFDEQLVDHVHMTRMPLDQLPEGWAVEQHAYFDAEDIHRTIHHHLASRERPTAVLCFGYDVAMAVASVARERGYSVPNDLSVVFVGVPAPFTHFAGEIVPIEAMTQYAAGQLIRRVEGEALAEPQHFTSLTHDGGTLAPAHS